MLTLSTLLKYYKREDIQKAIVQNAKNREVAIRFGESGFGKRPDVLNYPRDIVELAKQGATSIHISEEHWKNPLVLMPNLRKQELDDMRTGWDLVIDIDCHVMEYSQLAALLVVEAMRHHGIDAISCKFSGNKGFHIAIPYSAFPKKVQGFDSRLLFPDGARRIGVYLREIIKAPLSQRILEHEGGNIGAITQKTNKTKQEIFRQDKTINTEAFLDIDTVLISSRHMYRSVYSLNEKSGLSSIPIRLKELETFSRETAKPENVAVEVPWLKDGDAGEASKLFTSAFDFKPVISTEEKAGAKVYKEPEGKVSEANFAPCIKQIMLGLNDGRKRSVFILLNFLTACGYSYDEIKELLTAWNKKNNEPLKEVNLLSPVRYHQEHKKKVLPPNCSSSYYKDIGVCRPDNLCGKVKNPVNYSRRKEKYK
ncbi:MAG: hypothetical protein V1837_01480 [Candidatus Woesearchaeota archaeon]